MDVEGHEVEVLEGAVDALKNAKHVFLDIHLGVDRSKLFTLLKNFAIYDLKNHKKISHQEAVIFSTGEVYAMR